MTRTLGSSLLLCLVATLFVSVSLSACAMPRMWPAQNGQVVDWDTKKPIPGAVVVAMWEGSINQIADSTLTCYHVESATTDENGYFKIPTYTDHQVALIDRHVNILPYVPGYNESIVEEQGTRYIRFENGVYNFEKDTGPTKDRLDYLARMSAHASCGSKDGSENNLLVMQKAVYREAAKIAVSKEDRLQVINIMQEQERVELGSDISWENWEKRKRELK